MSKDEKPPNRVCPSCKQPFRGWGNQIYCSEVCQENAQARSEWERRRTEREHGR